MMKYEVFLLIVVRDMYDTYSTAPFTTEEGEGLFPVLSILYVTCFASGRLSVTLFGLVNVPIESRHVCF